MKKTREDRKENGIHNHHDDAEDHDMNERPVTRGKAFKEDD
jgi:hypothetical protein